MTSKEVYIKVTKNGPYLVYGVPDISEKVILADEDGACIEYGDGKVFEIKTNPVALCRCGKSKNAPFCDNSHLASGFDGTETADCEPILDRARKYKGPNYTLTDNIKYCAYARFCDVHGNTWHLVKKGDKDSDAEAIKQVNLCPSGRLMIFDKEGNMIENPLSPSIAVLEDGGLKINGPLWVRGCIRVESVDGNSYEVRNRQTLCRCGRSNNKPFCNGVHSYVDSDVNCK